MFDFATETILNDLSRVLVLDSTEDPTLAAGTKALFIKRLNKFLPAQISKIYKTEATLPVKETAILPISSLPQGTAEVFRLTLNVELSGSQDGDYSRWAINKGKPLAVEAMVNSDGIMIAQVITDLTAKFTKGLRKAGYTDVKLIANADNITVEATNEFQRFSDVILERFDDIKGDFVKIGAANAGIPGAEGVGTTNYILKNLRLPTYENVRFVGENLDERPIGNSLYDQYSFRLTADRNFTGQGAVGQKIQSVTTHTLFVLRSQVAAFEAMVNEVFGIGSIVPPIDGVPAI